MGLACANCVARSRIRCGTSRESGMVPPYGYNSRKNTFLPPYSHAVLTSMGCTPAIVDTFTYVCQCGCIGIDRKWRLCTSDERGLALTFLVRPGDKFTSLQPSATSPFVSTSGKPLRLA